MLYQRANPKGVDFAIHELQRDLFSELVKLGWKEHDSYDRVYRNKKGDDKIPEAYIGNGEYTEVLLNDGETVTSFFLTGEKRAYDYTELIFTQDVSIIYQADLSKLLSDVNHRADEEMINQIITALNKKYWSNRLVEVITGFEKVYDSLKLSYDNKEFSDMSNFCIVRFNFKMLYSNTEKITFKR